jgi:hypothetical protein
MLNRRAVILLLAVAMLCIAVRQSRARRVLPETLHLRRGAARQDHHRRRRHDRARQGVRLERRQDCGGDEMPEVILLLVASVLFLTLPAGARPRPVGNVRIRTVTAWYRKLMMPDAPTVSCCGEADAYWADTFETSAGWQVRRHHHRRSASTRRCTGRIGTSASASLSPTTKSSSTRQPHRPRRAVHRQ